MSDWRAQQEEERAKTERDRAKPCYFCSKVIGPVVAFDRRGEKVAHDECVEAATKTTKEMRPCGVCGYVRRILVRRDWMSNGVREWGAGFRSACSVCELRDRAEKHEQAARAFRRRASELERKRLEKHRCGARSATGVRCSRPAPHAGDHIFAVGG